MKKPEQDDLISLLIRCRAERQISQQKVARAIKLSQSAIAKLERREAKPHRTTAIRLAAFLEKHGYFPKMDEGTAAA